MNKILKLTGLALLTSGMVFSAATYAHIENNKYSGRSDCGKQKKWFKSEHRGFGKMKHALHDLGLIKEQRSEIKAIMTDAKSVIKSMHETMKFGREDLHSLMKGSDYDIDAFNQAANNYANLMAQQLIFMTQTKAKIFKILLPEQQQQFIDKLESRKY